MKPYKNQTLTADLMRKKRLCLLQAGCGFGKTITSLYASLGLKTLVVCPARVVDKFKSTAKALNHHLVSVISIEAITYRYKEHKTVAYDCIIIDECHKLRHRGKPRTDRIARLALKCTYRFLLSATPSQNSPSDFYMSLRLLEAHRLDYNSFRIRYCGAYRIPHLTTGLIDGKPTNQNELFKLVNSVRILAKDTRKLVLNYKIINLETPEYLTIPPKFEDTAKYNYSLGEFKTINFIRMIKKGLIKGPAVIFMHHLQLINLVQKELNAPIIIGKTKDKQAEINKFINNKEPFIIVGITAGGEGLDIRGVSICYFVEYTYSPQTDRQAFLRLARDASPKSKKILDIHYLVTYNEHKSLIHDKKNEYFKGGFL